MENFDFERRRSPGTLQADEEVCHLHLDPRFVLLLRDANVEHQLPRNLYDRDENPISQKSPSA
jgi:hypothetical protein